MARPHKPGDQKRTCSLRVRVTKAEKEQLENLAKEHGLNVSDWMRSKTLGTKPRLRKLTPDREIQLKFLAAFGKAGSNLNQLARQLNRRQDSDEYELPLKAIEYVLREVKDIAIMIRNIYTNGH
jgi:predicted PhzF superfamily epimerase YddE/YHI9